MAAGWPTKVSYANGDVFAAADINDTNGTLNYINPTSATDGQVLTRDNASPGKVKWATFSAGGMTLLSTTTLSGASTTISSISGSYNDLVAVIFGVTNATGDGSFRIAPNAATNITTQISTATATSVNSSADSYLRLSTSTLSPLYTSAVNAWKVEITNYASTTATKPLFVNGSFTQTSAKVGFFSSGFINTTSAITSLVFSNNGGDLSTGTVLLYGVK